MRFLVQSDDYGITKACAQGAIEGIRNGVIRNTGFFTNMPWAEEVFPWIEPYLDQIAFGIDLNASTGPSLLGYEKVPGLCHEDGSFLTSRENRALDTEANGFDHVNYDEVYAEFDAQIQKFIEIVGKKPDYIHGHAYGTKTTLKASMDLAKKYGCVYTGSVNDLPEVTPSGMGWYDYSGSLDGQLKCDPLGYIMEHAEEWLQKDVVYLVCHCGYVDREITRLSSFSVCRAVDLDCMCSDALKNWVKENNIELINFNDVKEDWVKRIDLDTVKAFPI